MTEPKRKTTVLVSTEDMRELLTTLVEDGSVRLVVYSPGAPVTLGIDISDSCIPAGALAALEAHEKQRRAL